MTQDPNVAYWQEVAAQERRKNAQLMDQIKNLIERHQQRNDEIVSLIAQAMRDPANAAGYIDQMAAILGLSRYVQQDQQ